MSESKNENIKKVVEKPSSNVGEMQNLQQQRLEQQQVQPKVETQVQQPHELKADQQWQKQQGVSGVSGSVGVTVPTTATTKTTSTSTTPQLFQQQIPFGMMSNVSAFGAGVGFAGGNVVSEPTIDLFNRFVAKDTHCLLGKTGIKVSRISLGTMNFGSINPKFGERPGQLDEAEAHKILDRFVELGGNCIDTAGFFPWFGPDAGKSEEIIGNWLSKQDREKIFLITKVRMPIDVDNINAIGLSRGHMFDSVIRSLKRLQTDTIDMLVLDGWDPTVSFHDTVRHLDDLVRSERIRYIGVCDFKGWQLQKFIDAAKNLDMHNCVCYMGEYNLLTRGCELEVVDVCKNERIAFIAYSPLKCGFLTNDTLKHFNEPVPNSRIESVTKSHRSENENKINLVGMAVSFDSIRQNPVYMNVLNVCQQLAVKYNCSVSQIAIQWILQKGIVTSVCVGVEDVRELEEKFSCLIGELVLSQQDMAQLDLVSSVHLHYPYRTQLAEVAGFRTIQALESTEFEQLNILTHALELEGLREERLNPQETVHESINYPSAEREFLKYPQQKAQLIQQQQLQQQLPQQFSSSLASGVAASGHQQNLINQAKIIQ